MNSVLFFWSINSPSVEKVIIFGALSAKLAIFMFIRTFWVAFFEKYLALLGKPKTNHYYSADCRQKMFRNGFREDNAGKKKLNDGKFWICETVYLFNLSRSLCKDKLSWRSCWNSPYSQTKQSRKCQGFMLEKNLQKIVYQNSRLDQNEN